MSNKTLPKLLQEGKKLNTHHGNCMKTKQDLEKAIADTQCKYKNTNLRNDYTLCKTCLNKL